MANILNLVPFKGGMNTRLEKISIRSGGFSNITNFRHRHPGLEKRKGQIKHCSTADGSLEVISQYQYSKGLRTERRLYAQYIDGSLQQATDNPPSVTTGAFGSDSLASASNPLPATYSNINDILLFSDGARQHQIFGGTQGIIDAFIVYKGAAAIPIIPLLGEDYTTQVTSGDSAKVAILDSLGNLAAYDAIFIKTPIRANTLNFTIPLVNGTTSVAQIHYWNGTWTAVSGFSDGTSTGGAAFGQTGAMSWTLPTDEVDKFQFGQNGFWCRVSLSSGSLDSEVEVSAVTYESDFQGIQNVWDGVLGNAIEAFVEDTSASTFKTYGSTVVILNDFVGSASYDYLYFNFNFPLSSVFLDPGVKPNTTGSTTVDQLAYWNGNAFTATSALNDDSAGVSRAGFLTWTRPGNEQPRQFQQSQYYSFWYRIRFDQTLSSDVKIGIKTIPYFDILKLGTKGRCNQVWKDRALYVFDKYPKWLYVSAKNQPLVLNGFDYAALDAGDGRANAILSIKKFYNEILVWQEEKGTEGGCLTLFEGYSPVTFGKLLLSTEIGILNSKCSVVVDGILIGTSTDEQLKTIAYWISKKGVFMTDGLTVTRISDDIKNYFDPLVSESITRGAEDKHWIMYDSVYEVLRMGLATSGTTTANKFFIYDLKDKAWSFDVLGQKLASCTEIEADSGNINILQVGGGTTDGFVYQTNNSLNDVGVAVNSFCDMEMGGNGNRLRFLELLVRCKSQTVGNLTVEIALNANTGFSDAVTIAMQPDTVNDEYSRNRDAVNEIVAHHFTLRWKNNAVSQSLYLLDYSVNIDIVDDKS